MSESKVFLFGDKDPEVKQASEKARANFRYFWRELAWERRRIIPGLNLACVKAPFSDGEFAASDDNPKVEHMWLSNVDFDGQIVSGELINDPNWLKTVRKGDAVRLPFGEISDWMYAIAGEVYGAYTVNVLRSRMGRQELQEHDDAWGLNFGDPKKVRVTPEWGKKGGFLAGLFGKKPATSEEEHPMSENMAPGLKEQLKKDRSMISAKDDRGWTLLHDLALAGSTANVRALLEAGADPNVRTNDGVTPLQLAQSLQWSNVIALLSRG